MADLTKARPAEMQSASGTGGTDPWSAPGGPASPVPGPGVSQKSRPRLSSASSVYNLAVARPVAGGRHATCHAQLEGPQESRWRVPPRPAPARMKKLRPARPRWGSSVRLSRVGNLCVILPPLRVRRASSSDSAELRFSGCEFVFHAVRTKRHSVPNRRDPVSPSV